MALELIVFIASILFGALLYWRESHGNALYRFFNKIMYSKDLQMKSSDKTGFVYKQKLIIRLISLGFLFLIGIVIARFIIPINIATISIFVSMLVGTIAGTYLANFIFKSSEVIDEKSGSIEDMVNETIEKGKDFIEDLKTKEAHVKEPISNVKEKAVKKKIKTLKHQKKVLEND